MDYEFNANEMVKIDLSVCPFNFSHKIVKAGGYLTHVNRCKDKGMLE
jgi:hypothetical protein